MNSGYTVTDKLKGAERGEFWASRYYPPANESAAYKDAEESMTKRGSLS